MTYNILNINILNVFESIDNIKTHPITALIIPITAGFLNGEPLTLNL